ncbi:hypothetical protein [Amycolatopsis acidicola]|uniref:hypothetical protein n=1 Tax=Amycolatopsis acidicola TaxID=2596893 RepID=UPI001FB66E15|nr:hypothetical protein [Amycolatopsis acidicola]
MSIAPSLRRLYFLRFGFALVWAGLLIATGPGFGPVGMILLVLYPLFDAVATGIDARASKATTSALSLYANIAISWLAIIGVAIAIPAGIPAVLRVWGAWAILSGLVQLTVGVLRRHFAGHWPMILSGGISAVAGVSFIVQAGQAGAGLTTLAGYAALGGVFFLLSALRLGRDTR